MALFDRNRALRLKRLMAEQFADLEMAMAALNGPDGSTLVTERNKVALAKLDKQWSQGRKRVAIFYGVGHLPDMAQRLVADFNLHETGQSWLTAWNLAGSPASAGGGQTAKPADASRYVRARGRAFWRPNRASPPRCFTRWVRLFILVERRARRSRAGAQRPPEPM